MVRSTPPMVLTVPSGSSSEFCHGQIFTINLFSSVCGDDELESFVTKGEDIGGVTHQDNDDI